MIILKMTKFILVILYHFKKLKTKVFLKLLNKLLFVRRVNDKQTN